MTSAQLVVITELLGRFKVLDMLVADPEIEVMTVICAAKEDDQQVELDVHVDGRMTNWLCWKKDSDTVQELTPNQLEDYTEAA